MRGLYSGGRTATPNFTLLLLGLAALGTGCSSDQSAPVEVAPAAAVLASPTPSAALTGSTPVMTSVPPAIIPVAGSYRWVASTDWCANKLCTWKWSIIYSDGRRYELRNSSSFGPGQAFSMNVSPDHGQFTIAVQAWDVLSQDLGEGTSSHDATNALSAAVSGPYPSVSGWYSYSAVARGGSGSYGYSWSGAASGSGSSVAVYVSTCPNSPDYNKSVTVAVSSGGYTYTASKLLSARPDPDPYCQ